MFFGTTDPHQRMLYDAVDEPELASPESLLTAYYTQLRTVIDTVGVSVVANESGVSAETIDAISAGETPRVTTEDAAAILAVSDTHPETEAIVYELRDHLLMGMTTGILSVDAIAAKIEVDLTGQEVQQALEGRTEMTLEALAAIQHVIETANN